MCVGYFLVLLDVTIVNVALPSIASGLGADVGSLQWVVDGYAIALASLMLPADRPGTCTATGASCSWGCACSARPRSRAARHRAPAR
jgi:MFS family permease